MSSHTTDSPPAFTKSAFFVGSLRMASKISSSAFPFNNPRIFPSKFLPIESKPRANLRLTGRHGKWGQCLRHKTQEELKEATAPTIGKRCVQERTELIEAPSSSILAEQTHWARVVACQSSVCGAGGTTNKFRSSVGGSNGQVECSTEEGGEPKRGRRGRGTRPRTPPSEPKPA